MGYRRRNPNGKARYMLLLDSQDLTAHRVAAGLTQRQLGALAGCSQQMIGMLERGDRRSTTPRLAGLICRALSVQVQVLFATEGSVTPSVSTVSGRAA